MDHGKYFGRGRHAYIQSARTIQTITLTAREQHYIRRPLDLLRKWHVKIEAWILEQAGIEFEAKAAPGALRVVTGNSKKAML